MNSPVRQKSQQLVEDAPSLGATAVEYGAELGWHILPVHGIDNNGRCTCARRDCTKPGKHPITGPDGKAFRPSADPAIIRQWWADNPRANIGVAVEPSGLVVVDVDPRNGGADTLSDLERQHGPIKSEIEASTGGGGAHFIFTRPPGADRLPASLGPGVDLKGSGYIIAAPSVHASGGAYRWKRDPFLAAMIDGTPPAPKWLARQGAPAPTEDEDADDLADVLAARRTDLTFEQFRAALMSIPNDAGGPADDRDTWLHVCAAVHHQVEGSEDGFEAFNEWSRQHPTYNARETRRVWESMGRHVGRGKTGAFILALAAEHGGWRNPGAAKKDKPKRRAGLTVLRPADMGQMNPPFDFIEGVLFDEQVSVLFGKPGAGKSFLALDLALSVATGRAWRNREITRRPTLYVVLEGETGAVRRVKAWGLHHGVDLTGAPFALLHGAFDLTDEDDRAALIETTRGLCLEWSLDRPLVLIDTLARAMPGRDENSGQDMGLAVAGLDEIREALAAHVLVVHHSGKDSARGARGHSSLLGAIDTEIEVSVDAGRRLARISKQRHAEDGDKFAFDLKPVALGEEDARGNEIYSAVAVPTEISGFPSLENLKLSPQKREGLNILTEIISEINATGADEMAVPVVPAEVWKAALRERGWAYDRDRAGPEPGPQEERFRRTYNKMKKELLEQGVIEETEAGIVLLIE
ncbi:AAA family ATPase [Novispirillum sp. DQ9]|uniref:AAA family ATPase n=1 Tax=Novispirillum sp. DQ9 TaxID=3398612 RepID=UPI003C7CC11E